MAISRNILLLLATMGASSLVVAQVFTPPQVRRPKPAAESQAFTVGADEPGCKDSLLLPRVAGCSILQCSSDAEDTVDIHIGVDSEGMVKKDDLTGASEVIYYLCPAKVSHASIIAAAESKLSKEGYTVAVRSKDADDEPLLTVMKDRQWIQISTYTYENSAAYIQTALLASPDEAIDPETVEQELSTSGRVSLTGVRFDKDKVDLPADADKLLSDLAALLTKKPEWKIRVHALCDESADPATCKALSEKRAASFVGSLIAKGVDRQQVTADLTTNIDDDSKISNSQIQLVKY